MNTTQHNVNRDMIHLYFLGVLHPEDCRRVEQAIRTDDDLLAYFRRQLAMAELTDQSDFESHQDEAYPPSPTVPFVYYARSEGVALAANHVAARDAERNASGSRDQSEPYTFTWKPIQNEHSILLTFVDHAHQMASDKELLLNVSFTFELNDSDEECEVNVGIVQMVEGSPGTWTGQFRLAINGLELSNITIMTLRGLRG